jgi:hypothetical protein
MSEIVTYANKSQGLFEELIHNEYDVPVRVLGWGTRWNGFLDKYKGMVEYLKGKDDDDIVVFLDGFDTRINKDPKDIEQLFKSYECGMLVSKDPEPLGGYISRKVFETCNKGNIANSGLYMGYVKYLRQVLEDALSMKCEDDQRNLNQLCSKYDFIKVDEEQVIFENIAPLTMNKNSDAIFVSYPATLSLQRVVRSLQEYSQFFKWQFIISMVVLLVLLPSNYKWVPMYMGIVAILVYALMADKSCV